MTESASPDTTLCQRLALFGCLRCRNDVQHGALRLAMRHLVLFVPAGTCYGIDVSHRSLSLSISLSLTRPHRQPQNVICAADVRSVQTLRRS